jgi:hypothetical protein
MAYMPQPVPATTVVPPRSHFSKWWPISFFISAVVFFIIGGGLLGAWAASSYDDCLDYDYYYSCTTLSNKGEFYGGIACVVIGAICKLVAWILLIVYCVKRRSQPMSVAYTYQPLDYQAAAPVAPAVPMNPYPTAPTPRPKEEAMGMRYCGHCGAVVTTAFCPQCGSKV